MSDNADREQNQAEAAERVPEFFEAGHEYSNQDGYRAPELVMTFRCGWVGVHPGTKEPLAFGFMHSQSLGWGGTGMWPRHWSWGWTDHGNWPLAGEGGVGGG